MTEFKIGITGHRPYKFSDPHTAEKLCHEVPLLYTKKYDNAIFNLGGCIGADSWVANCCLEHHIPFNLFLPFPSQLQAKYWNAQDADFLNLQVKKAVSVDIVQSYYDKSAYHARDIRIVDNSDLLICFLEDFKSGTYTTVKYALACNKPVFNGLANTFLSK